MSYEQSHNAWIGVYSARNLNEGLVCAMHTIRVEDWCVLYTSSISRLHKYVTKVEESSRSVVCYTLLSAFPFHNVPRGSRPYCLICGLS